MRIFPSASVMVARTFATAAKLSWISWSVGRSMKSVRRRWPLPKLIGYVSRGHCHREEMIYSRRFVYASGVNANREGNVGHL